MRGIPVVPVPAREKAAKLKGWPELATTDPAQISMWNLQNSDYNTAAVAFGVSGGYWFLDCDVPNLPERIESETGKKLPATLTVRSAKGLHIYFKQTVKSVAMGNIPSAEINGKLFDAQVHHKYVVGPGSIHPSGVEYTISNAAPIVEAPDWLIDWMLAQRNEKKTIPTEQSGQSDLLFLKKSVGIGPAEERLGQITLGENFQCPFHEESESRSNRSFGFKMTDAGYVIYRCHHAGCDAAGDIITFVQMFDGCDTRTAINKLIVGEFGSRDNYEFHKNAATGTTTATTATVTDNAAESEVTAEIVNADIPDMPETVLTGRLGEICQKHMIPHFPVAYAWPTLVTGAGVMVPKTLGVELNKIRITGGDTRTNLYTGVVGPVHSGKSQAIDYTRQILNIPDLMYSDVKAGSPEGLLRKIAKMPKSPARLMDIDEWKHYFDKASIDKSSFMTIMNSNFYKDAFNLVIGGGKEINIDCALSWIGGIVLEEYADVVGAAALGGFYDRMYQAICPSNYEHFYKPWEGTAEVFEPVAVRIDGSVWEVTKKWQRETPDLGRILEIAVRIATICASFDGQTVLTGKDLDSGAAKATLGYQKWVRTKLVPNAGENPDAQCSNAILAWLQAHAPKGEWVSMRDLKRGLNYSRMRLGPRTFLSAFNTLASPVIGAIEIEITKQTTGRPSIRVRLVV